MFSSHLFDNERVIGLARRVPRHHHSVSESHHAHKRYSPAHIACFVVPETVQLLSELLLDSS